MQVKEDHADDRLRDEISLEPTYAHRFGDWSSMEYLCKFGKDGSARSHTFYNGDGVSTRMSAVRHAITYIRDNWKYYHLLMEDLRSYISELADPDHDDPAIKKYLPVVLSSHKVWSSHRNDDNTISNNNDDDSANLSVIRLYTSKAGYDQIFRIINQAFRTHDLIEQERRLRCVVFLIELLNIDLFNYTLSEQRISNFHGTVYRGVVFSEEQLNDFKSLGAKPVEERFWAIPLAMMSASTNKEVALKEFAGFAEGGSTQATDDTTKPIAPKLPIHHPFLWRIHVVQLNPRYLRIYQDQFPSSVVSTICAVPIHELSDFANEDEVLLRGPFFQLVSLREEVFEGHEKAIHVMDLVMLNVNRDHPSTMEMGQEEGERARRLFALLVGLWRAEVCRELAGAYGLTEDVRQYEEIVKREKAKLAGIID